MQAQFDPDSAAAWQVRIFKKSSTRQAVLDHIRRFLSPTEGRTCLDIGGRDGVVPFMLRRHGGHWVSADSREQAVAFMSAYFGGDHVFRLEGAQLPFEDDSFDTIVILEHLERIREDAAFLKECHRCLRPGGELLLHVPHLKSFSLIRSLRGLLGLDDPALGRVRPGYRLRDLYEISKNGYDIVESQTYGGFLEEFVNLWLMKSAGAASGDGSHPLPPPDVAPDQTALRRYAAALRIHALLYPLARLGRGLDRLLRFTCNHHLVIKARPRPWIERRGVRMRDGRSIADAAINTKIGTAADLTDPKNNRS